MTIWLNKKPEEVVRESVVECDGHGLGSFPSQWDLNQLKSLIAEANVALKGFGLKLVARHKFTYQCPYCKTTADLITEMEWCCDNAMRRCPNGCQMPMEDHNPTAYDNDLKCSVCGYIKHSIA